MKKVSLSYLKRNLEARTVTRLQKIGQDFVNMAERKMDSRLNIDTLNLSAGFAFAVYLRGKIAYNTDREQALGFSPMMQEDLGTHKGWAKHGIPDGNAAVWCWDFFAKYKPPTKKFCLVIVNPTYYARILEDGKQRYGVGNKFRILTYLLGEAERISTEAFKERVLDVSVL